MTEQKHELNLILIKLTFIELQRFEYNYLQMKMKDERLANALVIFLKGLSTTIVRITKAFPMTVMAMRKMKAPAMPCRVAGW